MDCKICNHLIESDVPHHQLKTRRCRICYKKYNCEKRQKQRVKLSSEVRTCPNCDIEHQSPGYCGELCADCFRIKETGRKAGWRKRNREKDRLRLIRYAIKHKDTVSARQVRRTKLVKRELKKRLVIKAGGACKRCGYAKNCAALTFHHKDPSTKFVSISQILAYASLRVILTEIKKCELLCFNCHAEEHHPELTI